MVNRDKLASSIEGYMKLMVQKKTVVFPSIVAEEELTVTTVPHCAVTLMLVLAAVVTTMLFLCTSYREVC